VHARDFSFVLSRRQVPVGKVRFVVVNDGEIAHDFAIAGVHTRLLKPHERQTLTVVFKRSGSYEYACRVPGHAALGMRGTLRVGSSAVQTVTQTVTVTTTVTTTGTTSNAPPAVKLTQIGTFERPDFVTSPPGDPRHVFVLSQNGVIHEFDDGVLQDQPFLDISDKVKEANEPGLLGLAFAPDYGTSGRFYVFYNQNIGNGDLALVEYVDKGARPVDEYSGRMVMQIVKPYENHNGGMIQFGRDGHLYMLVGDGDSGVVVPPGYYSQRLDSLLGKVLRIDPQESGSAPYTVPAGNPFASTPGALPEIWAYGFRNPWRGALDPVTGDMLIGDVGEGSREELDLIPGGSGGGQNFGFPCFEGSAGFNASATCPNAVLPVAEWAHNTDVCSVIGGVYAHDPRLPALDGRFLVSDFCGGWIRAGTTGGSSMQWTDLGLHVDQPTSFGVDAQDRIYICSVLGPVYRIDPA
jgi:glucose/arabinose dehydrogenase